VNVNPMEDGLIHAREYWRVNKKWTIQRNWQNSVHNTKKNTTQYVLDTTINKQKQTTLIRH